MVAPREDSNVEALAPQIGPRGNTGRATASLPTGVVGDALTQPAEAVRYNRRRITNESLLIDHLRNLGAVELDRPRRRFGFEQRLERADSRPRTGEGSYIGHLADYEDDE